MIDIPEPASCEDCPCSYYIMTGEYEGMMMCNAMEFKAKSQGFHEELSRYFVVEEDHRPSGCPIRLSSN
jgi:hypothetical protein